jgi:hypothetical protein
MDEAICPYDFCWDGSNTIRDKEFIEIFSTIPEGVSFVWISDSCHSGDLSDAYDRELMAGACITGAPTGDELLKPGSADKKNTSTFLVPANNLNMVLLAACGSYQIAADFVADGRYNGAFTYFLLQQLKSDGGLTKPLSSVIHNVHQKLSQLKYSQVPCIEGCEILKNKPFLSP